MSWPVGLLTIYCLLIAVSSLFGGLLPSLLNLTHRRMQVLVSLVGGLMLGVAILHLFPHSVASMSGHGQGSGFALNFCSAMLLLGILTMFFMLRVFHFHHHEAVAVDDDRDHLCGHDHDHDHDCLAKHDHDHDAGHHHHIHHPAQGASWWGIFGGMGIHSLMDGGALAAALQADAMNSLDFKESTTWLLGLGAFLSVVLHKPLDSLTITTVMVAGGWSKKLRTIVNVGFALICPIGAFVFYFGMQQFGSQFQDSVLAAALAFSAGVFLVISLSDLLPEVQFHSHDRWTLSGALLSGVVLAYAIGFFEHGHMHGEQGGKAGIHGAPAGQNDHHGHAH